MPPLRPRLLAFPPRLDIRGGMATVEQGTDAQIDQLIALALLVRPGERKIALTYGTADPTFAHFQHAALERHIADFGPRVRVESVIVEQTGDGRETVQVNWEHDERARPR